MEPSGPSSPSQPSCACRGQASQSPAILNQNKNSPFERTLLDWAVKVTSVALAVFAAYTSSHLFIPFFFAGIGMGIYKGEGKITRDPNYIGGCLSNASPVELPPLVILAGAVGITAAHIDHHPRIAIPFQAFIAGMQVTAFWHWCCKAIKSGQKQLAAGN